MRALQHLQHSATVPDRLFDDPDAEARWRARFTAPRVSLPQWARDAPDRCLYTANASGTWEVYTWDRVTGTHRQVTDRPHGTHIATVTPGNVRQTHKTDGPGGDSHDSLPAWQAQRLT